MYIYYASIVNIFMNLINRNDTFGL